MGRDEWDESDWNSDLGICVIWSKEHFVQRRVCVLRMETESRRNEIEERGNVYVDEMAWVALEVVEREWEVLVVKPGKENQVEVH